MGVAVMEEKFLNMALNGEPTVEDVELADDVAWSMAIEGRPLRQDSYPVLLQCIVADRVSCEVGILAEGIAEE